MALLGGMVILLADISANANSPRPSDSSPFPVAGVFWFYFWLLATPFHFWVAIPVYHWLSRYLRSPRLH